MFDGESLLCLNEAHLRNRTREEYYSHRRSYLASFVVASGDR